MQAAIVLTVAQGKRLIAKAVAQMPAVRRALAEGTIAIGRGTTNGYIIEELLGEAIPKGEYVAGRTLPPGMPANRLGTMQYPDFVLRKGERVPDANAITVVKEMGRGDVYIKGGNALDYVNQMVGVLVGHPEGGTVGGMYGTVVSRKIELIIPIGLEKLVFEDLQDLSRASRRGDVLPGAALPSLFVMTGTIVTEIEAIAQLTGAAARLYSAGGVLGAEGALWLLLEGEESQVRAAADLAKSLEGEPNL